MIRRIRDLWTAALRSPDFKQGRGALKLPGDYYCCLGVLCELHSRETGTPWDGVEYLNEQGVLPKAVVEWAGLANGDPFVAAIAPAIPNAAATWRENGEVPPYIYAQLLDFEDRSAALTHLNDEEDLTFPEIADLIKASL